jgi:RNA polymerase sigma-70 factor (ECF subfamily)
VDLTVGFPTCQLVLRAGKSLEVEVAMSLAATWKHAEPRLLKVAERLCTSSADARDLVQDTFERAMRQGIPADLRNPCAWFTTILHHLFIDRCRVIARQPLQESLHEAHDNTIPNRVVDDEPAWNKLTIADVRAALPKIETKYREVYEMHTFEGRSYEDISTVLKIDRVTVGTRLTRARKKLREVLSAGLDGGSGGETRS